MTGEIRRDHYIQHHRLPPPPDRPAVADLPMPMPRLDPGAASISREADQVCREAYGMNPQHLLVRHAYGEWGDLSAIELTWNLTCLHGHTGYVYSRWALGPGDVLVIITYLDWGGTMLQMESELVLGGPESRVPHLEIAHGPHGPPVGDEPSSSS